ncbi:MAG: Integral rane sensor signal transduction histidine kinase [Pedosphaera sp.]|nr:Integral rane sensor signal transduction histidine kinase [Pedosphaera sp.]
MKTRFPLYAKILIWFFLNVIFLCVAFFVVARVQFKFGLDSLVAGPAGDQIQRVTQLLTSELRDRPRTEWSNVLKRFSETYKVEFLLYRNDGEQLAGNPTSLPTEVHARLMPRRGMGLGLPPQRRGNQGPPPEFGEPPGPDGPPGGGLPGSPEGRPPGQPDVQPMRSMLHTSGPNRYWVLVPSRLPDVEQMRPLPVVLVVLSESLSAGGLFFDVTPWVIGGIAVILISTLFWFPLVRGITRSISRMTQATEQIAEGHFEVRTEVRRQDELGSLSDAINRMAGRLAGLVTGQKRFLGDIAHELCSPIARIQVALGILEQRADEKQKAYLGDLREEVEHISNLVNELLSFSKASIGKASIKLQPVSVRGIFEKAVSREGGAEGGTEIRINVAEDLAVTAEPELLLRSVCNVLRNGICHAAQAGAITLSAARDGEQVVLNIEDCGPGVPEAALAQVFDPFYRVDPSRTRETGGVGLGLSIVKTCVESCGGTVSCENLKPKGFRVTMRLQGVE